MHVSLDLVVRRYIYIWGAASCHPADGQKPVIRVRPARMTRMRIWSTHTMARCTPRTKRVACHCFYHLQQAQDSGSFPGRGSVFGESLPKCPPTLPYPRAQRGGKILSNPAVSWPFRPFRTSKATLPYPTPRARPGGDRPPTPGRSPNPEPTAQALLTQNRARAPLRRSRGSAKGSPGSPFPT